MTTTTATAAKKLVENNASDISKLFSIIYTQIETENTFPKKDWDEVAAFYAMISWFYLNKETDVKSIYEWYISNRERLRLIDDNLDNNSKTQQFHDAFLNTLLKILKKPSRRKASDLQDKSRNDTNKRVRNKQRKRS